jgi:hypothetical protein
MDTINGLPATVYYTERIREEQEEIGFCDLSNHIFSDFFGSACDMCQQIMDVSANISDISNSLILWLDASGFGNDGDEVPTWLDKSQAGNSVVADLSAGSCPIYDASATGIRFNSNDEIPTILKGGNILNIPAYSIFVVGKFNCFEDCPGHCFSNTMLCNWIDDCGTNTSLTNDGTIHVVMTDTSKNVMFNGMKNELGKPYIFTIVCDTLSDKSAFLSGNNHILTQYYTFDKCNESSSKQFTIGGAINNKTGAAICKSDCTINEILVYNRALISEEIACVYSYLDNKWGVTTVVEVQPATEAQPATEEQSASST